MMRFGPKALTRTDYRGQMLQFLYGCRDEALAKITAEQLAQWFKLPAKDVADELEKARVARGVAA